MTPPASTQPFGAPHSCASCGAPFTPVVLDQTLCDRCHGLAHPEPASPLQDMEVAGYRLLHEIGAGRFSHSWLAEDDAKKPYILKLLRRYATDPGSVQRFLEEAHRLSHAPELAHPNLARPVNAGVHLVSAFFLVYESGGDHTLADELRERGRVPTVRGLELCAQIAETLAVLHRLGVVHLDLKPANVGLARLPDGGEQAVVLDGVTSHLLGQVGLRDSGLLPLSSAGYVSPEEARGARTDPRSDLYAVGVLLFQLLSGRLPYGGASAEDILRAHREHPPLRLKDAGRRVHADLETLVARLLSKDPAHRPHDGDELAVLLRALIPVADSAPPPEAVAPAPLSLPPAIFLTARELTPPQMLPPPVDPDLERAMMGEIAPAPPEKLPGIPSWVVRPSRLRLRRPAAVAAAAVAAAGLLVVALAPRKKVPAAPEPSQAPALPVAIATPSPPAPEVASQAPRVEPEPPLHKPAPSLNNKSFDRAQKAIWTHKPAIAQSILKDVLRKSTLSRRDRARASKLMGDAEVKRGHKAKAVVWYRKAFRLYDDPEERAKVAKLLQR